MESEQISIEILNAPPAILCASCGHVIMQDLRFETAKVRGYFIYHHVNPDCEDNQKMFKVPFVSRVVPAI